MNWYSTEYRREYKNAYKPKLKHLYRDTKEALRRYSFIKDIIKRNDVILDVGSGTGVFVYTLRKLGYNAKGIEPDIGYANFSIEELEIPVEICFAQDIVTSDSFDIITLHHVLEHLEDPFAIIKKLRGLLTINSLFVIEVPNAEDIKQDPQNRYHKAHLYTFNPETLTLMVEKAGFKLRKISIAPLNGNITATFEKIGDNGQTQGILPGNYDKILTILNKHTIWYHFTTLTPYIKFVRNIITAINEQLETRKYYRSIDVIDETINKEKQNLLGINDDVC